VTQNSQIQKTALFEDENIVFGFTEYKDRPLPCAYSDTILNSCSSYIPRRIFKAHLLSRTLIDIFLFKGYSLVSSTSLPFSLRYDLTRGDLSLVVEKNLDRESISSYTFDIIAYDGGNQTGLLHVYITIDDVNDSPPKFDQSIYTIQNVSENISINSTIIRVHATDDDEGVNGEITYYLINQENCFQIDQITGDIRVICSLDYETQTQYQLEIEARDGGEGSKSDLCR